MKRNVVRFSQVGGVFAVATGEMILDASKILYSALNGQPQVLEAVTIYTFSAESR